MAAQPDLVATRSFLEDLYGGLEVGHLPIFHAPSQQTSWVPANDLQMATATIGRLGQAGHVYIGIGVQAAPLGPAKRGGAATVIALPGLFIDIDILGGEHKSEALPESTRDAANLLRDAFPITPSLVIHSGGGLHCYWLFHEPWVFENEEERQSAARLNRNLQAKIIATAAQRGWQIESTADLARVLRPAGTINRKQLHAPVPVRTIHQSADRYSVEELEFYLPTDQEVFRRRQPKGDDAEHAPIALWGHVVGKCGYLRHCVGDAKTLTEPEWHAAMTIVARCRDGEAIAHRISKTYPVYEKDETTKKFKYSLKADAPLRCSTIRHHRGGEKWCSQCVYWGAIASPILLGYPRGYGKPRLVTVGRKEAAGA
jgi:hypothetical protein